MSNRVLQFLVFIKDLLILIVKILGLYLWKGVTCCLPDRRKSLKNEIVLITGGGQGLGREMAKKFSQEGATIVIWDINEEGINHTVAGIRTSGGNAVGYVCDVSNEEEVLAIAKQVKTEVGDVSILVNNAGVLENRPLLDINSQRIRRTIAINTMAHFWTIRAFLPIMMEKNKGHIVAISSISGLVGSTNFSDYSASKHAVIGLMYSLSDEVRLAGKNIAFTIICPVTIETGLIHNTDTRHSFFIPILTTEEAAEDVLDAIKKEKFIVTLPNRMLYATGLLRFIPHQGRAMVMDFMEYCRNPNKAEHENGQSHDNIV